VAPISKTTAQGISVQSELAHPAGPPASLGVSGGFTTIRVTALITSPIQSSSSRKGNTVKRIRRQDALPKFARSEAQRRRKYPYTIELPGTGTSLRCQMRRPYSVGEFDDPSCKDFVHKTEIFAWLVLGRKRIGAFQLNKFDPNGCGSNEDFMTVMDLAEAYEATLSGALCRQFANLIDEVTLAGPIVDFRRAWIMPRFANGDLFRLTSRTLVEKVSPHHSIMVMKAFPLEYEGEVLEGSELETAFKHRARAMMRYYQRIFGVRPFDGEYGDDGWLWREGETLA
jgi:hypothetical protein